MRSAPYGPPGASPTRRALFRGSDIHHLCASLTAVSLDALTRLELLFAVLLATAASGLVLGLNFSDRRRTASILVAFGGTVRDVRRMFVGEATIVAALGTLLALVAGPVLAWILVTVLAGVFDPPPTSLAVPRGYLALVFTLTVGAAVTAAVGASRHADHHLPTRLRQS